MWRAIIGLAGIVLFLYGIASAVILYNITWYSYFTIGGTLLIGYINSVLKIKSIFWDFRKNKVIIFKTWGFYILITIIIEFIGRYMLQLWEYPSYNTIETIFNVFIIGYPFAFFFIYETFVLIRKLLNSFYLTLLTTTLFNAFLHEIPNIFGREWVYKIPYVNFEILQINIVVILGWTILTMVPLIAKKLIDTKPAQL